MRILRALYHFLLFLVISWTVYNTFIFICLILPDSDYEYINGTIFDFWNFYLLGALDFHELASQISEVFHGWTNPRVLHEYWPFLLYVLSINGLAAYIWCSNQNPLSALYLALAPCIAGPYLGLVFQDLRLLIFGIIAIIVFYGILAALNCYRKMRLPRLSLPTWLEWRRPNMVPSFKSIFHKVAHMFGKQSS